MTQNCPTCGQPIPSNNERDRLVKLLSDPERDLYQGQDGSWNVTRGGGEFSRAVVAELVAEGVIRSKYNNCPDQCYHIGKTIDIDATMAARKKLGKKAPTVYADNFRSPPPGERA